MLLKDIPIQRKLMRVFLLISGIILIVTSFSFLIYEVYSFRQNMVHRLSTLGQVIATNSNATLDFGDKKAASEILKALKAEPQIIAAALYDVSGNVFAQYQRDANAVQFSAVPGRDGLIFNTNSVDAFQPVTVAGRRIGTIYLKSGKGKMYERFLLFGFTTLAAIAISLLVAYFLSRLFQRNISKPILDLAATARRISVDKDFSVRAIKSGNDELGFLSDSFNDMVRQIQYQSNNLKKINQEIDKSEKLFRALIEHSTDMKTLSTVDGKIFYASPSTTKILGYDTKEILDINSLEIFHPDDFSEFIEKRTLLLQKPGRSFFCQSRLKHKKGNWLWCEGTVTNMLHEPAIAGLVANFKDITDKKTSEQATRQAEASYREIFDKTSNAIYILDAYSGNTIEANKRAYEITGYTQQELLKNGGRDIFADHQDYHLADAINYFKKASEGQPQTFEWILKKKDGSISFIEVNLKKAIIAGKERVLAFFGVINERKKHLLAIENLNEELE
ncbi:MAG: PAS domain S-box protein, partial [Ginsengibacter sp.]